MAVAGTGMTSGAGLEGCAECAGVRRAVAEGTNAAGGASYENRSARIAASCASR
jgi:hypothetical protein